MDSRLDFESERVSPGFFGEVDLGSKPGNTTCLVLRDVEPGTPRTQCYTLLTEPEVSRRPG